MKIIVLSLCIICTINAVAQTGHKKLDNYFSSLVKNDQFNGNVLVAENGKVLYEHSFGYADFSAKTLNSKTTSFPIASISKTITTTAILQLIQSGKLKPSDPVIKYIPEFPYPNITLKHLLSHTSGLPPYNVYFDSIKNAEPTKVFTNADFIPGIIARPRALIYQPGERGNYDNINFIVLALIIQKVSGMDYSNYIETHVLKPAGMTHTKLISFKEQYNDAGRKNFAFPYMFPRYYSDSMVKSTDAFFVVKYWTAYNFSGFGDFVSTTEDLLKYDEYYNNAKWVDNTILAEAYTPVKLNNGKNNPGNFGLGWEVETDTIYGKVVYHGGNATGLSCMLLRNLTRHQTIIVFDNIHNNNSRQVALDVLKIINGADIPEPKISIAKVYGRALVAKGAIQARQLFDSMIKDSLHYYLNEDEMNLLGYSFLGGINNPNPYRFPEVKKYPEALETFRLNVEFYPNSWNTYDSYGEALLAAGRKEEAIKMYEKSIELNPKNEGGKKVLADLKK